MPGKILTPFLQKKKKKKKIQLLQRAQTLSMLCGSCEAYVCTCFALNFKKWLSSHKPRNCQATIALATVGGCIKTLSVYKVYTCKSNSTVIMLVNYLQTTFINTFSLFFRENHMKYKTLVSS